MPTLVPFNGTIALKGGTTLKNETYVGPARTLSIDTELKEIRIHDGVTPGGFLANSNLATVSKKGMMSPEDKQNVDNLANTVIQMEIAMAKMLESSSITNRLILINHYL